MVAGRSPVAGLARETYWRDTFADLHAQPHDYLDYATAGEQAFTFAACLLAAGTVYGLRCLDAGCGKGGFARMLRAAGARQVAGLDYIDATIKALRDSDPGIRWESGSVCDATAIGGLGIIRPGLCDRDSAMRPPRGHVSDLVVGCRPWRSAYRGRAQRR